MKMLVILALLALLRDLMRTQFLHTLLDVVIVVISGSDEWRAFARRLRRLQESARARVLRVWPLQTAMQTSDRLRNV